MRVSKSSKITAYSVAIVWLLFVIIPFYFLIEISLKSPSEFFSTNPLLLTSFNFTNYLSVLKGPFLDFVKNSGIVTAVSTFLILLLSSMASYAFAKFEFKAKGFFFLLFVGGMSIPIQTTLVSVYIITEKLGIYNTLWALVGPYVAVNLPVSIFILTGFITEEIPREVEEAALVDGCNSWNLYWRIILPMSQPSLVTVGIYDAIMCWNEFSYALVLLSSKKTLPLGLFFYQGQHSTNVPLITSAVILASLPILVIYIFFKDKIIQGMSAGAVKG